MKADTRVCRYKGCNHPGREVDISNAEYVKVGNRYFHKDCYELWEASEEKEKNRKKDLQFIKNLWVNQIDKTVVYSRLFHVVNDLISRGVSSEYITFTVQYCVKHGLHLNYPEGIRYFVNNKEIKDAYARKRISDSKKAYLERSIVIADNDDSPKFSFNRKQSGFGSILGGGK